MPYLSILRTEKGPEREREKKKRARAREERGRKKRRELLTKRVVGWEEEELRGRTHNHNELAQIDPKKFV